MNTPNSRDNAITQLLANWQADQTGALDQLMQQTYADLARIGRSLLRGERRNHTLQTGGLINEAYFRLRDIHQLEWHDRRHFFAMAANTMRRVLVDYARSNNAEKRGGEAEFVTLHEALPDVHNQVDILALDKALNRLGEADALQVKIVELRYFFGLTVDEAAQALAISPATLKRKWKLAQARLYRELH